MTAKSSISAKGIRQWQLAADVTGFLDGELKDWPANIQDVIYSKVEKLAKKVELPLTITGSVCRVIEEGDGLREHDRFYVEVWVSEVVAGMNNEAVQRDRLQQAIAESKGATKQ